MRSFVGRPFGMVIMAAFVVFAVASTASVGTIWIVFRRDPERAHRALRALEAHAGQAARPLPDFESAAPARASRPLATATG